MNQPAAYTPLESLFLFQSLLTHGVDNGAFVRISELLRSNALIKGGETYDPSRLSPDALQQLFLLLWRDELRSEAERAEGGGSGDGSGSPGSRKRKLGSPPLPTWKDVYENVDKVPILVDRLYARYRDHMVTLIREDERKFATVQREIQLLERSERERLAKLAASQIQSQSQNQNQNGPPVLAPRDPKVPATPNKPAPSPGPIQATPATVRRGPTPNTPILPPKLPTPTIAAPKPAPKPVPPSHLPPGTQPPRPSASPKPPNGAASVLQAPAGAPTPPTQPGPRVLQPPTQPPKQAISPRPEGAVPSPQTVAGTPQVAPPAAGTLKWEKPYQPTQPTQTPPTGQFPPTIAPTTPIQQKIQQQQQWQQPTQQPHPQHQLQQQLPQQQQMQYPSQPHGQPAHTQQPQARPPTTKPVLVPPQAAGQLVPPLQSGPPRPISTGVPQQARPPPTTPGRPIQPHQHQQPQQLQQVQQAQPLQSQQPPQVQHIQRPQLPQTQLAQKFQQVPKTQTPRPIASASTTPAKGTPGPVAASPTPTKGAAGPVPPQRWQPNLAPQQGQHGSSATSSAALSALKDKAYASPYGTQAPRPAIPEHMIRQAATPGPARRLSPASSLPRTPGPSTPLSLKRGFGTKWASLSTPSTPGPMNSEPQSPAYEPVSPPQRPTVSKEPKTKPVPTLQAVPKSASKLDATPAIKTPRNRPTRTIQRGRGASATPSFTGTRRSQSVASQTDELSLDHTITTTKVKKEVVTPRLREETGDTTADESVIGRALVTPGSISRVAKRKRQEIPAELQGPPTHVLWTRGFTKVSSSALDQISSHRDANMFATALREKDAPNYRQIVLQPQDITSIRAGIKAGNKAALQAAASLPGGDPGTASVWLPISDDLVPPKGIINSAHLERELVHMFCNAIMYNPDPNRGPGPAFLKRSQSDMEEVVGYRLDENGIVKNTQSMFLEVEKLLGDLRAAEKERGIPPISTTRQTPVDDSAEDEDELAGDGDSASVSGTVKRRRISTRG